MAHIWYSGFLFKTDEGHQLLQYVFAVKSADIEAVAFLKSVITTVESAEKEESTDENGNKVITTKTVIQKVPLIENDEELAEYEPILRKK